LRDHGLFQLVLVLHIGHVIVWRQGVVTLVRAFVIIEHRWLRSRGLIMFFLLVFVLIRMNEPVVILEGLAAISLERQVTRDFLLV
jgi:hypothetical protein